MQLTQRKKHLLKDQAGRRKEGGGRGDCCRWAQKRAIKIMEARWIIRLQDSSAEGPDKSTVFLARPFHCRDGCTKTSGMKREFFSTPPLSLSTPTLYGVFGRKQAELKRRLTLRPQFHYLGVYVLQCHLFRKKGWGMETEWVAVFEREKSSVYILPGKHYKYMCCTLSSAEFSEGLWNLTLSCSVGSQHTPLLPR